MEKIEEIKNKEINSKMEQEKRPSKRVGDSRTKQVHMIMSQHLNASGRLFGGMLMQWIDEVAGVVAMRHGNTKSVTTAAIDSLQFKRATRQGDILVMVGYVNYTGNTSMEVEVDSYVENTDGMRHLVNRAIMVMVAMDENDHPMQVPELEIVTEAEKARYEAALMRKETRKNRSKQGF